MNKGLRRSCFTLSFLFSCILCSLPDLLVGIKEDRLVDPLNFPSSHGTSGGGERVFLSFFFKSLLNLLQYCFILSFGVLVGRYMRS